MSRARHLVRTLPLAALLLTGAAAATAMLLHAPPLPTTATPSGDAAGSTSRVVVVPVRTSRRPVILEANGVLEPLPGSETVVTALLAGRITALLVEPGQTVQAGQPLAMVEPMDWDSPTPGSSAVPLSTAPRSPVPIRAPRFGVAADVFIESGRMLMRGQPIARLVDSRRLRAVVELPGAINDRYPSGHPAVVTTPFHRGELFDARLQATAPAAGPAGENEGIGVAVIMDVVNRGGLLEPGMAVVAYLRVRPRRPALLIPPRCLFDRYGEPGVRVVSPDGVVESRSLTTSAEGAGVVRVTHGLNEGDRVVLDGSLSLLNGERVTVRTPEDPASGHE